MECDKKRKFVAEESEVIIDIDSKGSCKFSVMSKVESILSKHTEMTNNKILTKKLKTLKYKTDEKCSHQIENIDNRLKSRLLQTSSVQLQKYDIFDSIRQKRHLYPQPSNIVALDCEFVGVLNDQSALGRCSIVDYDGNVICDIYARPLQIITSYRTRWSGITKQDMKKAIPLESALSQISDVLKDKIVVGHDLKNDFHVLGFKHPHKLIRDTSKSLQLKTLMCCHGKQSLSLRNCASKLLGRSIQTESHCSIIDARAALDLYKLVRDDWEEFLIEEHRHKSDKRLKVKQKNDLTDVHIDADNGNHGIKSVIEESNSDTISNKNVTKSELAIEYNKDVKQLFNDSVWKSSSLSSVL
ncbi:hypothetical protein ACF0H5_009366 [Mactra antiquata]